jgi:hypothetical protein
MTTTTTRSAPSLSAGPLPKRTETLADIELQHLANLAAVVTGLRVAWEDAQSAVKAVSGEGDSAKLQHMNEKCSRAKQEYDDAVNKHEQAARKAKQAALVEKAEQALLKAEEEAKNNNRDPYYIEKRTRASNDLAGAKLLLSTFDTQEN